MSTLTLPRSSALHASLVMSNTSTSHTAASRDSGDDSDDALLLDEEPQAHEIAADPAMRCRYPSKHCERQRATKKTGALHSMCAFHRAKANRNQRRLEKRKRFLKDEARLRQQHNHSSQLSRAQAYTEQHQHYQQSMTALMQAPAPLPMQPSTVMLPLVSSSAPSSAFYSHMVAPSDAMATRNVDLEVLEFEPFRSPVPLFKEDLDELRQLVGFRAMHMHVSYAEDSDDTSEFRIV